MINYKTGNILEATENIIVQSVNHRGVMGAGLAKQIATKWPLVNAKDGMYQSMCRDLPFSGIKQYGLVAWYEIEENKFIASVFGQNYYGTDRMHTDYTSLGNGFETIRKTSEIKRYSVAIPSGIGCGLGGGDWPYVLQIIEDCFNRSPLIEVSIYIL